MKTAKSSSAQPIFNLAAMAESYMTKNPQPPRRLGIAIHINGKCGLLYKAYTRLFKLLNRQSTVGAVSLSAAINECAAVKDNSCGIPLAV